MATCNKCGADIQFVKTKNGKNMPFDTELVNSDDCEAGVFLADEDGKIFKVSENTSDRYGFTSHFDTCIDKHKQLTNEINQLARGQYGNNSR